MIGYALRLTAMMLSMLGYILNERLWKGLKTAFRPIVLCGFISLALYFAGLLNLLPEAAWTLYLGGFLSLGYALRKRATHPDSLAPALLLLLLTGWVVYKTRGAWVVSYDSFSHWATVVKSMAIEDRMPTFKDPIIMFQTYPLGSALLLYYVMRFTAATEEWMLFAHHFMAACCLLPFAALAERKTWYRWLLIAPVFVMGLCTVGFSYYAPYVDTLMPLVACAAAVMALEDRRNLARTMPYLSVLLCLLVNIKQSGIFFYLMCLCLTLYLTWSRHGTGEVSRKRTLLWSVGLPCAVFFTWKKHTAYVFPNAQLAKHSMNLRSYGAALLNKSPDELLHIARSLLAELLKPDSATRILLLVVLGLFALFSLWALLARKRRLIPRLAGMAAALTAVMACYHAGLLAMYVFSMPSSEAARLAAFARYESSAVIFAYALMILGVCWALERLLPDRIGRCWIAVTAALALCLIPVVRYQSGLSGAPYRQDSQDAHILLRQQLIGVREAFPIEQNDAVLIYRPAEDAGVLRYMARYEFWTPDVRMASDANDVLEHARAYDWLIIWQDWELFGPKSASLGEVVGTRDGIVCIRLAR